MYVQFLLPSIAPLGMNKRFSGHSFLLGSCLGFFTVVLAEMRLALSGFKACCDFFFATGVALEQNVGKTKFEKCQN